MTKKSRFQEILKDYSDKYDLETLNSPNDRANLEILIQNQVLIERLQQEMLLLTESSSIMENIESIQRVGNSIRDLIERNLQVERALALDRKTRKSENSDSISSYLTTLKVTAQNFIEKRLVKVYCPDCKILLARFSPVMEHTAFHFETQCSQCNRRVTMTRKSASEGIFFDIKDYKWRKQYLYEVIQPAKSSDVPEIESDEDVVIMEDEDGSTEEN